VRPVAVLQLQVTAAAGAPSSSPPVSSRFTMRSPLVTMARVVSAASRPKSDTCGGSSKRAAGRSGMDGKAHSCVAKGARSHRRGR
jgi:hypothetical protein